MVVLSYWCAINDFIYINIQCFEIAFFIENVFGVFPILKGMLTVFLRAYLYLFFVLFSVEVSVCCTVCDHALIMCAIKRKKTFFAKILTFLKGTRFDPWCLQPLSTGILEQDAGNNWFPWVIEYIWQESCFKLSIFLNSLSNFGYTHLPNDSCDEVALNQNSLFQTLNRCAHSKPRSTGKKTHTKPNFH